MVPIFVIVAMVFSVCTYAHCEQYQTSHNMLSTALCDVLLKAASDLFALFCRFMEFDVIYYISLTSVNEIGIE
jgi:hypothetical protein